MKKFKLPIIGAIILTVSSLLFFNASRFDSAVESSSFSSFDSIDDFLAGSTFDTDGSGFSFSRGLGSTVSKKASVAHWVCSWRSTMVGCL